jgi:hypothetical protein
MSEQQVWTMPPRPVNAETALRCIRAQHGQIRALLTRAQSVARAALEGRPGEPDAVASTIGDIRTTMEVHLGFEERVLLPLFECDLPLGPERGARLRDEHRRQRELLGALHREAQGNPALPTLSVKLEFLIDWLTTDMAEEEEQVLVDDVVRDDQIAIDQSCG